MTLTRRALLSSLAAAPLAARPLRAAAPEALTARAGVARLLGPDGPVTAIWGYEGRAPGPEIRLRQGERVARRFVNELPQASTVHWHGIRIDNAMDGVPGMTQAAVEPGTEFLYDFAAPDAGTFWYHPHNRTWEQLARGLYGPLIVEEAEPPAVDAEAVLMIDDWRLDREGRIDESFGAMMDWSHAGRIGNWITVNGEGAFTRAAAANGRLRLRLVNAANARVLDLEARGLEGWVAALDGMPLERPEPLARLTLAPAQRADLIVDVTAPAGGEALLVSHERDGAYAVAAWNIDPAARPARLAPPAPLPPNPARGPGALAEARVVSLVMEGGAMGGLATAMMEGRERPLRELAALGRVWAFNGRVDMPEAPLVEAVRGETVAIRMENRTGWPHAMHLHGHHFRAVGAEGPTGPLRDTLLVPRGETATVAFLADNPGDWLLHCHMVEHAAAGMMTWVRVV